MALSVLLLPIEVLHLVIVFFTVICGNSCSSKVETLKHEIRGHKTCDSDFIV